MNLRSPKVGLRIWADSVVILEVRDLKDVSNGLDGALMEAERTGLRRLLLDLTAVDEVYGPGLVVLRSIRDRWTSLGGLIVVEGPSSRLQSMIVLCTIYSLYRCFDDRDAALAALFTM